MSGYRQWHLPKPFLKWKTGSFDERKKHFKMTKQMVYGFKRKKDVISMMDTNMDTLNITHNEKKQSFWFVRDIK